ncbi:hypothetical protein EV361DRAFT_805428, partial [Lentinula raphanica]
FKCPECTKTCSRFHDLKRHGKIHLGERIPCPYCHDHDFSRKDALRRHVNSKNIEERDNPRMPQLHPDLHQYLKR